ncbi:hypothetical protein AX14_007632, partial [Amanita brunnescens Koide BX004]
PPPDFGNANGDYDDDAYTRALAEADTCDNSSCPGGPDAPAHYTIIVEAFDEGLEEFYDRSYRACAACNQACKKSFLGNRIKSCRFDNSLKDNKVTATVSVPNQASRPKVSAPPAPAPRSGPVPGSTSYAREHPINAISPEDTSHSVGKLTSLTTKTVLGDQNDPLDAVASAIYLAAGLRIATPLPFPPPNVHSLFFVDDGLLYCASKKPTQNVQCIEKCLDRIQTALATLGLFVDVEKTDLIHFPGFDPQKPSQKLLSPSNLPIRMRNLQSDGAIVTIKPKEMIRYLGFFFDSELNWNAHVTFYFNRAFSTIRALRMLGSSIRGLGTLQKRHAYQACALPVLTYGLPLCTLSCVQMDYGLFSYNTHWSKGSHCGPPPPRHTA